MPRKKQVVQQQKRNKAYRAGAHEADATHIRRTGFFKFFGNYTLFAVIGTVVLFGGFLFTSFYQSTRDGSSDTGSVRGQGVTRETPEAESTRRRRPGGDHSDGAADDVDRPRRRTSPRADRDGEFKVELNAEAPQTVNNS
jgi:hypothetical protein